MRTPEQDRNHEEQSEGETKQKFAAYEAANMAGGGETSRLIWGSFTEEEKKLWKEQAGPLIPNPEKKRE